MTPAEIAKLRELHAKATPGPWCVKPTSIIGASIIESGADGDSFAHGRCPSNPLVRAPRTAEGFVMTHHAYRFFAVMTFLLPFQLRAQTTLPPDGWITKGDVCPKDKVCRDLQDKVYTWPKNPSCWRLESMGDFFIPCDDSQATSNSKQSWNFYLKLYGSSVSLIKNLSEHQCKYLLAQNPPIIGGCFIGSMETCFTGQVDTAECFQ